MDINLSKNTNYENLDELQFIGDFYIAEELNNIKITTTTREILVIVEKDNYFHKKEVKRYKTIIYNKYYDINISKIESITSNNGEYTITTYTEHKLIKGDNFTTTTNKNINYIVKEIIDKKNIKTEATTNLLIKDDEIIRDTNFIQYIIEPNVKGWDKTTNFPNDVIINHNSIKWEKIYKNIIDGINYENTNFYLYKKTGDTISDAGTKISDKTQGIKNYYNKINLENGEYVIVGIYNNTNTILHTNEYYYYKSDVINIDFNFYPLNIIYQPDFNNTTIYNQININNIEYIKIYEENTHNEAIIDTSIKLNSNTLYKIDGNILKLRLTPDDTLDRILKIKVNNWYNIEGSQQREYTINLKESIYENVKDIINIPSDIYDNTKYYSIIHNPYINLIIKARVKVLESSLTFSDSNENNYNTDNYENVEDFHITVRNYSKSTENDSIVINDFIPGKSTITFNKLNYVFGNIVIKKEIETIQDIKNLEITFDVEPVVKKWNTGMNLTSDHDYITLQSENSTYFTQTQDNWYIKDILYILYKIDDNGSTLHYNTKINNKIPTNSDNDGITIKFDTLEDGKYKILSYYHLAKGSTEIKFNLGFSEEINVECLCNLYGFIKTYSNPLDLIPCNNYRLTVKKENIF